MNKQQRKLTPIHFTISFNSDALKEYLINSLEQYKELESSSLVEMNDTDLEKYLVGCVSVFINTNKAYNIEISSDG